jgi:hypothetical protein
VKGRLGQCAGAIILALALAACGEEVVKPNRVTRQVVTGDIPCAPDRVLRSVCQHCHSSPPQNGAPFSLVTYADTQREMDGHPLWFWMEAYVSAGIMPLPPVEISDADRALLLAWLRAGAPPRAAGEACDLDAGTIDEDALDAPALDAGVDGDIEMEFPETASMQDAAPIADTSRDDASIDAADAPTADSLVVDAADDANPPE